MEFWISTAVVRLVGCSGSEELLSSLIVLVGFRGFGIPSRDRLQPDIASNMKHTNKENLHLRFTVMGKVLASK